MMLNLLYNDNYKLFNTKINTIITLSLQDQCYYRSMKCGQKLRSSFVRAPKRYGIVRSFRGSIPANFCMAAAVSAIFTISGSRHSRFGLLLPIMLVTGRLLLIVDIFSGFKPSQSLILLLLLEPYSY